MMRLDVSSALAACYMHACSGRGSGSGSGSGSTHGSATILESQVRTTVGATPHELMSPCPCPQAQNHMQRDIDKQHQVKIISYQKVLAASGAEGMPKLGRGHTRMLLTRQGLIDMVDLLLGKEQQPGGQSAEQLLDWLQSAEALPSDRWDHHEAYDGDGKDSGDGDGDGGGDADAADAAQGAAALL